MQTKETSRFPPKILHSYEKYTWKTFFSTFNHKQQQKYFLLLQQQKKNKLNDDKNEMKQTKLSVKWELLK